MTTALVCPRCGAALAAPVPPPPFLTCSYCATTVALASAVPTVGPAWPDAADAPRGAPEKTPAQRFSEAVGAALRASMTPYDAVRTSAEQHLAPGQGDALAKVTVALLGEFDAARRCAAGADAQCLARVALAYQNAVGALRDHGTATLSLPFLTATEQGPLDFERTLTPAEVTAICQRPVGDSKKKGWWPFGG
jgi:hypothetical protein